MARDRHPTAPTTGHEGEGRSFVSGEVEELHDDNDCLDCHEE